MLRRRKRVSNGRSKFSRIGSEDFVSESSASAAEARDSIKMEMENIRCQRWFVWILGIFLRWSPSHRRWKVNKVQQGCGQEPAQKRVSTTEDKSMDDIFDLASSQIRSAWMWFWGVALFSGKK